VASIGKAEGKRILAMNGWQRAFWIATAVCIAGYVADALTGDLDASSFWGMTYGTVATAFMVGSALYAVRRRTVRLSVGTARGWQQFHVYGGTLFMLLTFMHAAFRVPTGPMTTWLMVLSIWVFASGLLGVLIQKWIPRLLLPLRVEALYDRIPELVDELREKADRLAGELPAPVRDFHRRFLEPEMRAPRNRLVYFINARAGREARAREFDLLRGIVSPEAGDRVRELEALYVTKLELDAHYTLQKALRWWLYSHVPPSLVLLALVALHIFAVFYY
jgi:hypothetical protein